MASIEPLKTSIRIIWYIDGKKDSETLTDTPPTPANKAHAQRIADMVEQQISMGIFNRDQVFPDSPKRQAAFFGHYIPVWQTAESGTVSPSTWKTYKSKVANHIEPYWHDKQISKINAEDIEHWVYQVLKKKLSPKTIIDVLNLWRSIWRYWARHQKHPNDPSQYIKLTTKDPEDINPFTRDEIRTIINSETDQTLRNLWTVMLWSGLSSHELMPLAVEDIDIKQATAHIKRGFVKGQHRVTKNRRRNRQIELLPIVVNALANQSALVATNAAQTVDILDRDNHTYQNQQLTWLWYNARTDMHYTYPQLEKRWKRHLKLCDIEYRPLNNGRHTYASQVLSTGAVSAEWLANQLGHVGTDMIHRHYGKFIPSDSRHIIRNLDSALKFTISPQ